jgi:hypothetical protein
MALTSSSTIDEIKAAYVDNSAYDVNGSVAQAKLFVQACRVLVMKMPKMAAGDRASLSLSPELVNQQMADALQWLGGQADTTGSVVGGGGTRHFSFENLRGDRGCR